MAKDSGFLVGILCYCLIENLLSDCAIIEIVDKNYASFRKMGVECEFQLLFIRFCRALCHQLNMMK